MKHSEEIDEKIQELLDGKLSEAEASKILKIINEDKNLKVYYQSLKVLHNTLYDLPLQHPSTDFTAKVMSTLHQKQVRPLDIRSLLIFLGLIICGAVGLIYASQVNDFNVAPVITELALTETVELSLPAIHLPSSEILLKIFYFGLLFLSLIYFDKVILRQLFRQE